MTQEINNRALSQQLRHARTLLDKGYYLQVLPILDKVIIKHDSITFRKLRASMREIVNDLTGSLGDIITTNCAPDRVLMESRLLAKLGFGEDAVSKLRSLLRGEKVDLQRKMAPLALGLAGRRFDLELLGLNLSYKKEVPNIDRRLKGCIIEHLVALGEFDACLELFVNENRESLSILALCDSLNEIDTLKETDPLLSPATIETIVGGIRGWLSLDEASLLATLASKVNTWN